MPVLSAQRCGITWSQREAQPLDDIGWRSAWGRLRCVVKKVAEGPTSRLLVRHLLHCCYSLTVCRSHAHQLFTQPQSLRKPGARWHAGTTFPQPIDDAAGHIDPCLCHLATHLSRTPPQQLQTRSVCRAAHGHALLLRAHTEKVMVTPAPYHADTTS